MKRKGISLAALLLGMVFAFGLVACDYFAFDSKEVVANVVQSEETVVVIAVDKAQDNATLVDVMEYLQVEEQLNFTIDAGGMVESINGKYNPADWSACWMVYTSDVEFSNQAWGVYEYNGQTLGSATLGAEALPVCAGAVYVWVYQSF